jgi:hypothetical protein
MRFANVTATLCALPLFACSAAGTLGDEGWHPAGSDKADDTASGVTLDYNSYDVLFTNPLCREYTYPSPAETADGSLSLTAKPKNVYCSRDDIPASAARLSSPQNKLLTWLTPLGAGDEVFLAFLSFSNAAVGDELCNAVGRGVRVTFVLDARSPAADKLEQCGGEILLRGHAGSIGYAHNKVILINPKGDSEFMKMTFSSGNMSSGIVTHHENWHFIDVKRDSYFAQTHVCLMDAQLSTTASSGKAQYRTFLNACRADITALEEDDIKAFFVPSSDDRQRAERYMLGAVDDAKNLDIGVHRFGHTGLISKIRTKLEGGKLDAVRMVADDDLYWLDPEVGTGAKVGSNDFFESNNVRSLMEAGPDTFEIRYFETNHREFLLHHNKYVVYRDASGSPFGMIGGAANLTKTGFTDNFENIYFIKVPMVLEAFDTQFARVWDGQKAAPNEQDPPIATPRGLMPVEDVTPQ